MSWRKSRTAPCVRIFRGHATGSKEFSVESSLSRSCDHESSAAACHSKHHHLRLAECKEREGHTVVELLLLLWWVRRVLLSSSVFSSVVVVCCWILRILAINSQRRVFGLIVRVLSIKALLGGDECWWCVEFTREIIIFCDTFCSTFHFGVTRKEWLQPTFLSLSDVLLYIGQ